MKYVWFRAKLIFSIYILSSSRIWAYGQRGEAEYEQSVWCNCLMTKLEFYNNKDVQNIYQILTKFSLYYRLFSLLAAYKLIYSE